MRRGHIVILLVAVFVGSVLTGSYLFSGAEEDNLAEHSVNSPIVFDVERDPDVPPLPFDDNPTLRSAEYRFGGARRIPRHGSPECGAVS